MGYENIVFKIGDGSRGWAQHAPYDKIIVTAGAPSVPEALAGQLAVGGRMVIPCGDRTVQTLEVVEKRERELCRENACDVVFVPLVGEQGWEE
jgi:protein-L-isoaspartate(D-aspartate) O-methyltransferase